MFYFYFLGNFMRSVHLLAEYDPILNQLLNYEKKR